MKVCVIPARGGSKRIPRKNIKLFNAKPIIAYSIEAALSSGCFDQVIVSTDDPEIAQIAEQYGAICPFLRPAELSDDFATTVDVINHAIQWFKDEGSQLIAVCCLYATAPFVTAQVLSDAYQFFINAKVKYCFSVTEYKFPIQRAIKITSDNRIAMFEPDQMKTRSQDLEVAYHDAGQFYWGMASAFLAGIPLFSSESVPFVLPHYQVQDIDTPDDWKRAEYMFQVLQKEGLCR